MGTVEKVILTVEHELRSRLFYIALLDYLPDDIKEAAQKISDLESKIEFATTHHDFEKRNWPEPLLVEKRKPTEKEWEIYIYPHPIKSAEALSSLNGSGPIDEFTLSVVKFHQVQYDGITDISKRKRSYPFGYRGMDLGFGPNMMHAVDALDAMISKRPYRKHVITIEKAVQIIARGAGTEFANYASDAIVRFYREESKLFMEIANTRF
jgi:HD-GYP domain-containing protein (c-di-GMP phosphodiesterase class II)